MTNDRSAQARARLERALDRLERVVGAAEGRGAKARPGAKNAGIAEARTRLDAAIAELDRTLEA